MKHRRTATRLGAASIIGIAMLASPQAAVGDSAPALNKPTISGAAVVDQTLTASVQATGDPPPTLAYQWLQCAATNSSCDPIPGATESAYVVSAADVGRRLAVRVRATNGAGSATGRSALTAVVTAPLPPEPTPTPVPGPEPAPSPTPDGEEPPERFDQSQPAADAPGEPTVPVRRADGRTPYLRPFPVVRITGTLLPGGARISRLGIRAPATARVAVRCTGSGCRFFSRTTGSRRVRALERVLRAGTRITIRISRPGAIGKHVAIRIRDGRKPRRRDACLMPGSTRPVRCPAP